ncbi:rrp1p [Saccharomyces arboricola H-6]|uniref:Rrp1p n=1 Tax=Saccharomyces arboricola (strain H-6 / AS 2.3317 / CBS 10644) TaxID=1160507 RepID=J8Q3N7_SACAR|nr:rrp1p [Saccharomyces arboricola H-6]
METSKFVKQLSSNNRKTRENALEALKKYLTAKKSKEDKQIQFNKLWKGLYYAMWFSDRPRPQQSLANKLGELHGLYFDPEDNSNADELTINDKAFIKFSKGFWKVMCFEWFNIDRYRLDKYLLLIRRVLFNQLKYLQSREWNEKLVAAYIAKVLRGLPLSGSSKVYTGIPIHIVDIILDEWERLLKDEDEEEDDEDGDDEKREEQLRKLTNSVKETPLTDFIAIFQDIVADYNNSKVLKEKIKEDLFSDARLVAWGVLHDKTVENVSSSESEEEEAEEWEGF